MRFLLRLLFRAALVTAVVIAVRVARGDDDARLAGLAAAAILFGPGLLRALGPRKKRPGAPPEVEARPSSGGVPSRAEYLSAGVDTRTCGRCRRPIRGAAFFFSLDDRPTVYCESCWNVSAPPDDPVRRGQWMTRLAGGFERRAV